MRNPKHLYIVCYDVREPKRLNQALHIVRDYATGGQKSVFECFLDHKQLIQLKKRLRGCLRNNDRALITRIKTADTQVYGKGIQPVNLNYFYIG